MKVIGNIIYIPNESKNCVIKSSGEILNFEKSETLEEMQQRMFGKLKDAGLGKFKDHVTEFVDNCNLYGIGSTKMRIIPEYRISNGKIKVYVLMWNGTMEETRIHGLPLKIKSELKVLENMIFTELPNIKPGQFILFEGIKNNENGLEEDSKNKVTL